MTFNLYKLYRIIKAKRHLFFIKRKDYWCLTFGKNFDQMRKRYGDSSKPNNEKWYIKLIF